MLFANGPALDRGAELPFEEERSPDLETSLDDRARAADDAEQQEHPFQSEARTRFARRRERVATERERRCEEQHRNDDEDALGPYGRFEAICGDSMYTPLRRIAAMMTKPLRNSCVARPSSRPGSAEPTANAVHAPATARAP